MVFFLLCPSLYTLCYLLLFLHPSLNTFFPSFSIPPLPHILSLFVYPTTHIIYPPYTPIPPSMRSFPTSPHPRSLNTVSDLWFAPSSLSFKHRDLILVSFLPCFLLSLLHNSSCPVFFLSSPLLLPSKSLHVASLSLSLPLLMLFPLFLSTFHSPPHPATWYLYFSSYMLPSLHPPFLTSPHTDIFFTLTPLCLLSHGFPPYPSLPPAPRVTRSTACSLTSRRSSLRSLKKCHALLHTPSITPSLMYTHRRTPLLLPIRQSRHVCTHTIIHYTLCTHLTTHAHAHLKN